MDEITAAKLNQINAEFYQTFAAQFSDTRMRLQPGVRRILDSLDPEASLSILDLGCGNGELARDLARRRFRGAYLGLDFSEALLIEARRGLDEHPHFVFAPVDLADGAPAIDLPRDTFDRVFAFAVLHHIPGRERRAHLLRIVRGLLPPDGLFIHSNWQFLRSERLRKRIHPWSEVGLLDDDVDPDDYLLDWRRGGFGLRYVHHFSEPELASLAADTGFRVLETFYSDGESGDLGLYQIWGR